MTSVGCNTIGGMAAPISNAFDTAAGEVKRGDEGGDEGLTALQKLRIEEARSACLRCRQGFCSDHGTKLVAYKKLPTWAAITQLPDEEGNEEPGEEAPQEEEELGFEKDEETEVQEEVKPQQCRNQGCGKKFTEDENHSSACHYHRGPVSYSNRSTDEHKWVCCEVTVPSFEDLASVPPCTRGKHYAPSRKELNASYRWHREKD